MSEHSPVSNLTTEQCWELLHAQGVRAAGLPPARRGAHRAAELCGGRRSPPRLPDRRGQQASRLTINDDVAFEIDEFGDEEAHSVVVRGRARQLERHELDALDQLPLRPWVDTAKFNVIAIDVDEINGRRFELTRPWTHLRPPHDHV